MLSYGTKLAKMNTVTRLSYIWLLRKKLLVSKLSFPFGLS